MRKIILFIFLLFLLQSMIFAQEKSLKKFYTNITDQINSALLTKQSSIELSGFMFYNYDHTKYDYDQTRTMHHIQAEPVASYFVADDLALGLNVSYQYQKIEFGTGANPGTTDQVFVGPLCKYYFGDQEFRPFVMADYLFLMGDDFEGGEVDIGGGLFYHLAGNFGINVQFKYGYIWSDVNNIDSQNRMVFGIGISNFIF